MGQLQLTTYQHQRLRELTKSQSRFVSRKSIALLEIASGQTQEEVADSTGVDSRTIRRWIDEFRRADLRVALKDERRGRSGRKRIWSDKLEQQFLKAMRVQPNELGYQAVVWTVDLLRLHLEKKCGQGLSNSTLRRRLHERKFVWKRPKYQLLTDPEKRKKNRRASRVFPQEKEQLHVFVRG